MSMGVFRASTVCPQYSIADYRESLYLMILQRRRELKQRQKERVRFGARPRSHSLSHSNADDAAGYAYTNIRQP